ncbi:ParB/RepB/Spo0J family partition protein [Brucella intermedia]|uniref:ParB/RepB/Spo0J family partition protein n=1 Tax=Brucella intermedia TaxID=94625 RepID=UPI000469B816|nr:ParB N-terminal domain-containing protein [Brucella intermedia]
MERRRLFIDDIFIGNRHRNADGAKVAEIAKSIAEVGLMNPPAVCIRDEIVMDDGELCDGVAVLIYGRHRLAALKMNGEEYVECVVHDVDDLHAELMEIDENLARSELSPAEEASHIARRKAIWEEMRRETFVRNSDKSMGRPKTGDFAREIASLTGNGKSQIAQKISRAEKLGHDINRIVGTSLDKGVEMDALIGLPDDERENLISRAERGEKVSARPAPEPKPITADKALEIIADGAAKAVASNKDRKRQAFWDAWAALDETDRQEFAAIIWSQYKTAN